MADTLTLSRAEYDDLIDARNTAIAIGEVIGGTMPVVPDRKVEACFDAATPLAFWRAHRGLTPSSLASSVGVTIAQLSEMEVDCSAGEVIL